MLMPHSNILNNARTLAFCVARSLLPPAATALSNPDHFTLTLQITTKQITRRYSSSLQDENGGALEVEDFEDESPYVNIDFKAIAGDDPHKIRQLKKIQLEIDILRQQGEKVPSSLTTEHWIDLLALDTQHARINLYTFLWSNEHKKIKGKEKRRFLREEYLSKKATEPHNNATITTSGPIIYSLGRNTLFWRLTDTYIRHFYNLKLLNASMFNPHLIIDCSYEPFMSKKNIQLCAKQMLLTWAGNRLHPNPFHLVFCNLSRTSEAFIKVARTVRPIEEPDFPFNFTPEHYLNLYPREKLVYLTPHCSEELDHYNRDDIYIIGAFVDKNRCEPLSLAKAKKEKLRMAKFPLDKYFKWQIGTKSLTINQCLAIMTDLKDTNDWKFALKHVPNRKTRLQVQANDEENSLSKCFTPAKVIREHYRRNLVYDLLMKDSNATKKQ